MLFRRKILFWFFLAASLVFLAVPSVVLMENVKKFLGTAPEDRGLTPSRTDAVPHGGTKGTRAVPEPRFVRFSLKAPGAKAVFLAGDFNLWRRDHLALKAQKGGAWELLLPLPPGRYRYRFVVDGKDTIDPANTETEKVTDETVSIKTVP